MKTGTRRGAAVPLSRTKVNRHKVSYLIAMRAVLREMCHANRSAESLRAAEEVEVSLASAYGEPRSTF